MRAEFYRRILSFKNRQAVEFAKYFAKTTACEKLNIIDFWIIVL
ncbi:hypothetical protein COI_0067 [Mannheimia haemolytica serotype A2 str. OVINE]|nr:hypothetical protein COI_0067 [Mannheimia haemolytica serotype A2 str. OVINE]EEY11753.1 hypothetical protein COK_2187 [Mannheimia haemolytica serotype A2 str. BOVINE]